MKELVFSSGLVNVTSLSITAEGTEFESSLRHITSLITFKVFFRSLMLVWKQFVFLFLVKLEKVFGIVFI